MSNMEYSGHKYAQVNLKYSRRSHALIQRMLQIYFREGMCLLDVGCADGMVGKLVPSSFHKYLIGIEYDVSLAEQAAKVYKKVYQHDLDILPLPLDSESIDIVVAADVIEHCKRDKEVTKELYRILKPGGICIISLPNIAQFPFRFQLLFGNFNYTPTGVLCEDHLHFYTLKTMRELLKRAGFHILKEEGSGTLYSFLPVWKTFLAPQIVFLCSK
ncbi:MAG: class I SAM-dependent methyltransferase [Brevinematales bacterium]|nr:class I SAM-dependent methyltransferase [Brevinematales bacterium]